MTTPVNDLSIEERALCIQSAEQALGGILYAVPENLQPDTVALVGAGYAVEKGMSLEQAQENLRIAYGLYVFVKERTQAHAEAGGEVRGPALFAGAAEAEDAG
jgi:hypothetical protein